MKINGKYYQTIWLSEADKNVVQIIDQRWLPHTFVIESIHSCQQMGTAIKEMHLRGAPCIGAAAVYGMYLATLESPEENFLAHLQSAGAFLKQTRPTAVDLFNAVDSTLQLLATANSKKEAIELSLQNAQDACAKSVEHCRLIGVHGVELIKEIAATKPNQTINILTHCNAGWIACVDYGTATSPIYAAHDAGIPVHVWVDETRPRNQGARITAFELLEHGVPHTVIADNVGGHLMQQGLVDIVIVGSDRTTRKGDVANKIGTYLKALAAKDNQVPFYVALPYSSFDWTIDNSFEEITIEKRSAEEVRYMQGLNSAGTIDKVLLTPQNSPAVNYGFDITPARLVTGLITERGICAANESAILTLFPEHR